MKDVTLVLALFAVLASYSCGDSDGSTGGEPPGVLVVGNSTVGTNQDTDGYVVTVDGGQAKRIGLNGAAYWSLAPGTYSVELTDLQPNCATDQSSGASTGPNPQNATITASDTAQAWFAVDCT